MISSDASILAGLELADELLAGRDQMLEPQDLPGRYGRVIKSIDRLLQAIRAEALVGGGWAVWRHGYLGRVTQDVDILVASEHLTSFIRTASISGFDVLPQQPGRWPKLIHKETGVRVHILPEGERPGTESRPAPTTLPSPTSLGANGFALRYISLPALVELKVAAGRAKDESDVVELIRSNPAEIEAIKTHLRGVHPDYVAAFEHLITRSNEERER